MPEVLANLRWFDEELPALPVIAAGSLLDFVLADHAFSMPVGRITYLHLEPVTTGTLKSLHHFMATRDLKLAVRVNADRPSITEIDIKATEGVPVKYRLMSLPFYLAGQLHRILDRI